MKCLKGVRTAALFVGSVVGAGFATGQEVRLFFGGDGVWSLVIASLFMAVCAFAFLSIGERLESLSPKVTLAADTAIALCSFAFYAAMIAAAEEVLFRLTGAAWLSILLSVFVTLFIFRGIGWVSLLNVLAVPFMAAIIVLVGARSGQGSGVGFHPLRALAYGGMNLLFSGALMAEEGKTLSLSGRITASVTAGGAVFLMLFFMWRCTAREIADMPFLAAASRDGLGTLASLALLLAIVTTMAGCAYLLTDRLTRFTKDRALSSAGIALCGILTSSIGFAPIVAYAYPVVSALGLAATTAVLGYIFLSFCKTLKERR